MLEKPPIIPEKKTWPYFEQPNGSKEFVAAKNFMEKYIDTGKVTLDLVDTPENMQKLLEEVTRLGNRLLPGNDPVGVVVELKKAGVIAKPEKIKQEKPVEFIQTEYVTLEKPKEVNIDEEQLRLLEANLLLEELKKANIFKNDEDLDSLYQKCIETDTASLEHEQYYFDFVDAGLIKGGQDEVRNDLNALVGRKQDFEQKKQERTKEDQQKLERAKKIASITERGLADGVTKYKWYGENVTITPASEFDDIKRGVDDILEIRKEDEESSFIGLGIDVTYRGLESEEFKQKFFKLLESIYEGYKTKVKYGRNYRGEPLKEFAIPRMVLSLTVNDVKDMADILRHGNEEAYKEKLQNSVQKYNVMRQIVQSSKILSGFAEESQNNIFRKYNAVISSFKELSWENPEIKKILESEQDDQVSKKLSALVVEFKLQKLVA